MKLSWRIGFFAVLAGLGLGLYLIIFPSEEKILRRQLLATAQAASFVANEGALARAGNLATFAGCFTDPVELNVNVPGGHRASELSRSELLQVGAWARAELGALKVQFLDITLTLSPDHRRATAELTVRGSIPGDDNYLVQEMKFDLRKLDGRWLIKRVETIRVLN
jgi:hypothetical protein